MLLKNQSEISTNQERKIKALSITLKLHEKLL